MLRVAMGRTLFVLVLHAVWLAPEAAHAVTIVLESYPGERPPKATEVLAPLVGELTSRGFEFGEHLGVTFETRESKPGGTLDAKAIAAVKKLVTDGFEAWLNGDFTTAREKLGSAISTLNTNPAAIVKAQELRKVMERAIVGYALASLRLQKRDEAERAMADLLRSFPDTDFSRITYGPEALDLYVKVKEELDKQGRGSLFVDCDSPNAVVFINERYEAVGNVAKQGLWPGTYRIVAQYGTETGRVHMVEVEPNGETTLKIERVYDTALVSAGWTGFQFHSPSEQRSSIEPYALRVASALSASDVVVVGIVDTPTGPAVVGARWSVATGFERSGSVFFAPGEQGKKQLRALGRFLAGDAAEEGVRVNPANLAPLEVDAPANPRGPFRFGAWKWATVGSAAAAIAGGFYMISIDGNGVDCPPSDKPTLCAYQYDTLKPGIGLVAGGVLLGGLATWMFLHDHHQSHPTLIGFAPISDGAGVWVMGEF
jgi:hypothetical protein